MSVRETAERTATRFARSALVRWARAQPPPYAERRVHILLTTAWGMGGTIRANLNLAGHLARSHPVEIISVSRERRKPFFGDLPPGVRVVTLEDRRAGARVRPLQRLLRRLPSVLMHPDDRTAAGFNLWVDVQLARRLRRASGFLIATRPGLNMVAARLAPPGLILIGEEQMNLGHHVAGLRKAMPRLYPRLDALVVVSERDIEAYAAHLDGRVRTVHIPNTVRDLGPVRADLNSRTVLAAGRLTPQKGFDMLISAWRRVAAEHPDWHLRICGKGKLEARLADLIREHDLGDAITLAGPAGDIAAEMSRASMFVLSSRVEGLPLVLLEAMSAGMAVVSFDCPTGPSELIDDHRNGILVPARDVDALAAGIVELIEHEDLRERFAAAAKRTAAGYTMAAVGPRWDDLLGTLDRRVPAGA